MIDHAVAAVFRIAQPVGRGHAAVMTWAGYCAWRAAVYTPLFVNSTFTRSRSLTSVPMDWA